MNCTDFSSNETLTLAISIISQSPSEDPEFPFWLQPFRISYMYYSLVAVFVLVLVGYIVSAFTGKSFLL